jgi:hypothetical protein
MHAQHHSAPHTVSFRHLLTGSVEHFLRELQLDDPDTAESIAEIMVMLSRYREEGVAFFPLVFLGPDLSRMLHALGGQAPLELGSGPRDPDTVRRALKQCAPLSQHRTWAVYFTLDEPGFRYGVFRVDDFPLVEGPFEKLRRAGDPSLRVAGLLRQAENVVELRGSQGATLHVYLSGARTDLPLPAATVDRFAHGAVLDVPRRFKQPTHHYLSRVLGEVMQAPHGTLAAVVPVKGAIPSIFVDGVRFKEPVDVAAQVAAYVLEPGETSRAHLRATARLIQGMLGADGVTLFGSNGTVLAYNTFVVSTQLKPSPSGGARLRTFDTMRAQLGNGLVGAFYRSQDGNADADVASTRKKRR